MIRLCEILEVLWQPDVRYSYEDVEKHCKENGYYIGEYWFPNIKSTELCGGC